MSSTLLFSDKHELGVILNTFILLDDELGGAPLSHVPFHPHPPRSIAIIVVLLQLPRMPSFSSSSPPQLDPPCSSSQLIIISTIILIRSLLLKTSWSVFPLIWQERLIQDAGGLPIVLVGTPGVVLLFSVFRIAAPALIPPPRSCPSSGRDKIDATMDMCLKITLKTNGTVHR